MAYDVRIETAEPRPLAAVKAHAKIGTIGLVVRPSLDKVYAAFGGFSKEKMGHNVIFYPDGGGLMSAAGADIYCGVEMKVAFADTGEVIHSQTPAGQVAHTTHWGDYAKMSDGHQALHAYCAANGHKITGVNWEVYGDMYDDISKVRTDIYYQLA